MIFDRITAFEYKWSAVLYSTVRVQRYRTGSYSTYSEFGYLNGIILDLVLLITCYE